MPDKACFLNSACEHKETQMTQFLVYQSLWAMERRRPDGAEWSLGEKLEMIRSAGFDGCGVRFADRDFVRTVTSFLRDHGMSWQAQCYPRGGHRRRTNDSKGSVEPPPRSRLATATLKHH